jgi:hypothetical protein
MKIVDTNYETLKEGDYVVYISRPSYGSPVLKKAILLRIESDGLFVRPLNWVEGGGRKVVKLSSYKWRGGCRSKETLQYRNVAKL